jgi:hypothetical protein
LPSFLETRTEEISPDGKGGSGTGAPVFPSKILRMLRPSWLTAERRYFPLREKKVQTMSQSAFSTSSDMPVVRALRLTRWNSEPSLVR